MYIIYNYFLKIWSDLKHRSKLFVSLFKNKDAKSALLCLTGISILFFSLQSFIWGYALLLFPAALSLYLLVGYQLLLSFVSFKLTAFNTQRQFKNSSSGWLSEYILQFFSKNKSDHAEPLLNLLKSVIKDIIKWAWSELPATFNKIRPRGFLQKILLFNKKITFRIRKDGLYQKMVRGISKSHSHFWQFLIELVVLCIPSNNNGKGFLDAYLNILYIFYYTIPLKVLKKLYSLFVEFISNLPSHLCSLIKGIPGFLCDLFLTIIINNLLRIFIIPFYVFFLFIVGFILSTGSVLALLYSIVRFPCVLYQFIKQIVLFLMGLTRDMVMHWFLAVSLLLISIALTLLSSILEFPVAIPEQLILSIAELSAILAICAFVMISSTLATRKAYFISLAGIFIFTVMQGAYFALLASLLLFYFRADRRNKVAYAFFYLICFYFIDKIGFSHAGSEGIFYRGGLIFLLATDYEEDVEYPNFLFLALHGSYQELEQSLKKLVGLYDEDAETAVENEHTETTVESVKFANNDKRKTDACYRDTDTEGMTSNACDEVTTQPTAMLLDGRSDRLRSFRRYARHKSWRRRNPYGFRRRRGRYTV